MDVGECRVGVAISDQLRVTAQPGPKIPRKPDNEFFGTLANLIQEWDVREAAVGLPRGLKGQKGTTYDSVIELLAECRKRWPQLVWTPWEERFTTKEAELILRAAPRKQRREKGLRDQVAAQLILESYLQFRERGEG